MGHEVEKAQNVQNEEAAQATKLNCAKAKGEKAKKDQHVEEKKVAKKVTKEIQESLNGGKEEEAQIRNTKKELQKVAKTLKTAKTLESQAADKIKGEKEVVKKGMEEAKEAATEALTKKKKADMS